MAEKSKFEVSKQEMIDFLLETCVMLQSKITAARQENGFEDSVLNVGGEEPEYQKTVNRLLAQIDRQDKWLRKRREEVTILQNRIRELRERKEYYKDKAAHGKTVRVVKPPEDDFPLFDDDVDFIDEDRPY